MAQAHGVLRRHPEGLSISGPALELRGLDLRRKYVEIGLDGKEPTFLCGWLVPLLSQASDGTTR